MGDWADDILSGSAGDWADEMLSGPPPDPRFKPWTGPAQIPLKQTSEAGAPQWSGGSPGSDAAFAAAGGVMSGLGLNPRDTLGDQAGGRVQIAHERRPWVAGGAQLLGEGAVQAAAAPAALARAPVAMGALSGLLSGVGNTEGDLGDKAKAGIGGAAAGAWLGGMLGTGTGSLASLLERKGPQWVENQATHGLMGRGATPDDLARMDKLGGRQRFYEEGKQLGIPANPQDAARAAREATQAAAAERAAIEARNAGVQVDPAAVEASVRAANPYPGVGRYDRATERAAEQVGAAAPDPRALDVQRAYYGDATNFASGSPNAKLGKGIHGAVNNELEDAYNLAEPGAGSQWRQAGRNMNTAMEIQPVAQRAADVARAAPITLPELATGGALRVLNNNRHGIAEGAYGAGADMAGALAPLLDRAQQPLAGLGGNIGGGYSAGQVEAAQPPKLDQVALDMLRGGGQDLGPYKAQFAEAAGSPSPGAVNDLITRLTMTDPQFRTQLLPLLRGGR